MAGILLTPIQVTSHDASKSFVEKVKADDKAFSSYPVGDYLIMLHFLIQLDPPRADTMNSSMSLMAWTRSSQTRLSHGSLPTSQRRPVRQRRRSFKGTYKRTGFGT